MVEAIIGVVVCLSQIGLGLFGGWLGFYGIVELVRRTC